MRDAGISVVRDDASWDSAEAQPPDPATGQHQYRWAERDARVAAMARYGLRWYPIVDYSASWASSIPGDQFAPPARDEDFAAFAAALAARYGRGGAFWAEHPELPALPVESYEIWNEPDFSQFWHADGEPGARYASLYASSRAAIKQADPAARVVVGGLVDWNGPRFVRAMYRARPDLRGNVDALGYHEYHHDVADVHRSLSEIRRVLRGVGGSAVPIELTEVGWSSVMETEAYRAKSLGQVVRQVPSWGLGVTRVMPFSWLDGGRAGFGIAYDDGSLAAPGVAYADAISAGRDSQRAKRVPSRARPGRPLVRPTAYPVGSRGWYAAVSRRRTRPRGR
jgi:hypothetical protein